MKKIIALVLMVAMLVSGSALVASAYTPGVDDGEFSAGELFGLVAASFDDATVTAGETVEVELKTVNNVGFTELEIALTLDEGISLTKVTAAEGLAAEAEENVVVITAETAVTEDGVIAVLEFTAAADASGKKGVTIDLIGKNGDEELETTSTKSYITVESAGPAVEGDVNNDGAANTTDLAVLKKLVAGLIAEDDATVVYPDINGDNIINTTDLAVLKKLVAGL